MHTVVVEIEGKKLPPQLEQFVKDLNWLKDEGYIDYVEDPDGVIRLVPVYGKL